MTEIDVIRVCLDLALCTEEPGKITRTFLSPPMCDVHRILGERMRSLNMRVSVDAAGNLRGLLGDPQAPRLIIGSHLDTVPDAGAFDGILGVVIGVALAAERSPGPQAKLALEVIGFSEEEGVRFGTPFIGSRALAGTLDAATLAKKDRGGVSVEQAIREFGLDSDELAAAGIAPVAIGYLEFHIEQGPVLDRANLPLASVDTIAGQTRLTVVFSGHANHAGTTPMKLRRDALAAAAEWIAAVESVATSTEGLVATVGALNISPNAGNVIAERVEARLDVRHALDPVRLAAVRTLLDAAYLIGERRGIVIAEEQLLDQPAVPMNSQMVEILDRCIAAAGFSPHRVPSGAGHDAMIVAPRIPSAMLFLRSPGGISHHPEESVSAADVAAALVVGRLFIAEMEATCG
jgi:allantoate deiminase